MIAPDEFLNSASYIVDSINEEALLPFLGTGDGMSVTELTADEAQMIRIGDVIIAETLAIVPNGRANIGVPDSIREDATKIAYSISDGAPYWRERDERFYPSGYIFHRFNQKFIEKLSTEDLSLFGNGSGIKVIPVDKSKHFNAKGRNYLESQEPWTRSHKEDEFPILCKSAWRGRKTKEPIVYAIAAAVSGGGNCDHLSAVAYELASAYFGADHEIVWAQYGSPFNHSFLMVRHVTADSRWVVIDPWSDNACAVLKEDFFLFQRLQRREQNGEKVPEMITRRSRKGKDIKAKFILKHEGEINYFKNVIIEQKKQILLRGQRNWDRYDSQPLTDNELPQYVDPNGSSVRETRETGVEIRAPH